MILSAGGNKNNFLLKQTDLIFLSEKFPCCFFLLFEKVDVVSNPHVVGGDALEGGGTEEDVAVVGGQVVGDELPALLPPAAQGDPGRGALRRVARTAQEPAAGSRRLVALGVRGADALGDRRSVSIRWQLRERPEAARLNRTTAKRVWYKLFHLWNILSKEVEKLTLPIYQIYPPANFLHP